MSDKKISELTNITGANLADADEFVVVDTSASETKAITWAELKEGLDTGTGFVRITGDTMTGNLSFGDNDKAIFGAGSDLQIYHDGNHSRIVETGGGDLIIQGDEFSLMNVAGTEYMIFADNDSFVKLYYDGSAKLATTSTGVDVTGTVTADGLTVAKGSIGQVASFSGDDVSGARALQVITSTTTNTGDTHSINAQSSTGIVKLSTNNNTQRLSVFPTGDISFYEDTGTTAKFFWDASAERLGIGTSSPSRPLEISGSALAGTAIKLNNTNTNRAWSLATSNSPNVFGIYDETATNFRLVIDTSGNVGIGTSSPSSQLSLREQTSNTTTRSDQIRVQAESSGTTGVGFGSNIYFVGERNGGTLQAMGRIGFGASTNTVSNLSSDFIVETASSGASAERMRIDSSGNVGIGTSSPSAALHLSGASTQLRIEASSGNSQINFADTALGNVGILAYDHSVNAMTFRVNSSERMRIDASGNLLVGRTATTSGNTGVVTYGMGQIKAERDGGVVQILNRHTSDGDIALFQKDGSTVGSIASRAGLVSTLILDPRTPSSNTGAGLGTTSAKIVPADTSGLTDAKSDLGAAGNRFKDLYLSGGVYLGGTGAANLLDDYEEGTWTPDLTDGTTSATYAGRTGNYTKIGNTVYVWMYLIDVTTSGLTAGNQFQINGLPFASQNATFNVQLLNVSAHTLASTNGAVVASLSSNSTTLKVLDGTSTQIKDPLLVLSIISGATDLYISGTYRTA